MVRVNLFAAMRLPGLLILIINIIGGLAIGMTQYDMSFQDAGEIYVLLTIGDGLVAQIPSLILSLATAIIVTRVTTSQSMTEQTTSQLANPTALYVTAAILLLLGIIPGMPSTVFISWHWCLAELASGCSAYEKMRASTKSQRNKPQRPNHQSKNKMSNGKM